MLLTGDRGNTLETLPPELLDTIVSYIQRPSELKSVCLASRLLRDVAMPKLYHRVILDLRLVQKNEGFFTLGHPGHQHIRRLLFTPLPGGHIDEKSAQAAVKLALQLLPRHKLTEIEMPENVGVDDETLLILCTQQRALKDLSLGSMMSAPPPTARSVQAWLPELRRLDTVGNLYGITAHDLDFHSNIIKHCPRLISLGIRMVKWPQSAGPETLHDGLQDSAERNGLIFEKMFGHINPGDQKTPNDRLKLHELWLDALDLSFADRTFSRVIHFEELRELHLYECPGTDVLLQQLAKLFKKSGSCLRGFICTDQGIHHEVSSVRAIQDFLTSFSGLMYFQLMHDVEEATFDVRFLSSHIPSLIELYVGRGSNAMSENHWLASLDDLRYLGKFPKLRQLVLAMPQPVLPISSERDWKMFWEHMELVAQLPALTILRILSWPIAPGPYAFHEHGVFKDLYRRDIDDLASRILQRLECCSSTSRPRLNLLCIGDSCEDDTVLTEGREESWAIDGCMSYRVGATLDHHHGLRHPTAIRTDRKLVKYIEPVWNTFHELDSRLDAGIGIGTYG